MLRVSSAPEALAGRLREAIAGGDLRPGEQLHQEQLAARYGFSRSPLREALRLLHGEGLVDYQPNRGATVAELDEGSIREIFEIRELLEVALVRHAVANIDEKMLARARQSLAQADIESDPRDWLALHQRFHQTLYAAARRPRMLQLALAHQMRVSQTPHVAQLVSRVKRPFAAADRRLLAALRARDPEAAVTATLAHLRDAQNRLLDRPSSASGAFKE